MKTDTTKEHYRLVHFYKRSHEPKTQTLQQALAMMEQRRLNSSASSYTELWKMTDEENGEMVAFFEDGAPADIEVMLPTTAKLR